MPTLLMTMANLKHARKSLGCECHHAGYDRNDDVQRNL
jgi:hypothetical protein